MRFALLMGLVALTGACATGGSGGGDAAMAYGVPNAGALTYVRGDSLFASIEVPGMGAIDISFEQSMTLGVTFAPSASGATVTATVEEYSATLSNPIAGTSRASSSNVTGSVDFTLDATGRASLTGSPKLTGAASMIMRPLTVAHELLPRLPGRSVSTGDTWTDTIQYSGDTAVGTVDARWHGTYTVTGTEEWRGITVTRVESAGTYSISSGGDLQGMYVEMDLSGPEAGYFLWDATRRVVVYHQSIRDLAGTVEAEAAPGIMEFAGREIVKNTLQN